MLRKKRRSEDPFLLGFKKTPLSLSSFGSLFFCVYQTLSFLVFRQFLSIFAFLDYFLEVCICSTAIDYIVENLYMIVSLFCQ